MKKLWLVAGIALIVGCEQMSSQDGMVTSFAAGPYDHLFSPIPLRVGTKDATYYHRPFAPRAQQSLVTHGETKRINFYTTQDIMASGRQPALDSMSDLFECPTDPDLFAASDSICTLSRKSPGIPTLASGKVACQWNSYTLVVVDAINCNDGTVTTMTGDSPLNIDFIYFNSIPSGIGDADGDGDITENDFDFLVACYSGSGNAAGGNCKNCFDYDLDGDVDMTDFSAFLAEMGQGNSSWIAANWPTASRNPTRPMPLRVAMAGSTKYHLEGCPAVLRSRDTYGWHKYFEYYSRDKIDASNRVPDLVGSPYGCDASFP